MEVDADKGEARFRAEVSVPLPQAQRAHLRMAGAPRAGTALLQDDQGADLFSAIVMNANATPGTAHGPRLRPSGGRAELEASEEHLLPGQDDIFIQSAFGQSPRRALALTGGRAFSGPR